MGDLEVWNNAEASLKQVLEQKVPGNWHLNPEDAAFYGPKLDFDLTDALGRKWQCGTIQLDFQLPERFNLRYRAADKPGEEGSHFARPVMIHRAILGSLERFMAIITENTGGKWPFWLAPNQIVVIPITTKSKELNEYTEKVVEACRAAGLRAENDLGDDTLKKKVRTAVTVKKTPIVFVVGADEQENNAVNVRNRDDEGSQERGEVLPLATVIAQLVELQKTRVPIIPAFSQK